MLVILSGVSGAGKDTIKRELINRMNNVTTIASFTDRPKRPDDRENQYNFITKEEFENMIKNNELYEYSVHHNHYYGTSKKVLDENIKQGKIIVKDIDVNGTADLINIFKNTTKIVTIFLKVPKDILKIRLENRVANPDLKDIQLRLNRFDYEQSKMSNYDYIIKNNNLEKTVQIIMTIIENEYKLGNNTEF